jgi:hypothetical protein
MSDFEKDMKKFAAKTKRKENQLIRKFCLDLFGDVVQRSPVDTGRFKSNWQPAIGAAASGVLDDEDKSGAKTKAKIGQSVSGAKVGDKIFLVNNLPYAQRLESGWWSTQAPRGMVGLAVKRAQSIANKIGLELKKI